MKRMTLGRTLFLLRLLALGFSVAWTPVYSRADTDLRGSSGTGGPQVAVSTRALDFGAVRVQGSKDLTVRIWNVGGGVLNGTASVTGPFAIKDATYSLKSGQGKTLSVRYQPAAPGTNTSAIVLSGADKAQVLLTGRAGVPPQPPQSFRVITPEEVSRADFIVRYSDDRTSYVVKPAEKEVLPRHAFYTPLTSAEVLNAAAKQPRRELMIIVLPRFHYHSTDASAGSALDETKRLNWLKNLGDLIKGLRLAGYQSLIFCEGRGSVNKIAGLRVVEGPEKALATSGG